MNAVTKAGQVVPDHVPPHLIWDWKIQDYCAQMDDPHLAISRLHEGPEIIWWPYAFRGTPAWLLTRYSVMHEVSMDPTRFSSVGNSDIGEVLGVKWGFIPIDIDPPAHTMYRMFLNPFFSPQRVAGLEGRIRQICRDLTDEFAHKGSCEYLSEFASLLPASIFLAMMGMPLDQTKQFHHWDQTFVHGLDPAARIEAAHTIKDYLEGIIAARRADPQDDIISSIVTAEFAGRRATDDECISIVFMLYVGGLDTVASSLGWIMRHLTGDLALQDRLRANPALIPQAVEELLRAYSFVSSRRVLTEDVTLRGVSMRKGDAVLIPSYLASRDPARFENPHVIDIDRKLRHLAFGIGPHVCLGMHLARPQLRIVLEEQLACFANLRVPKGEVITTRTGLVWGVDRLPLTWDRITH